MSLIMEILAIFLITMFAFLSVFVFALMYSVSLLMDKDAEDKEQEEYLAEMMRLGFFKKKKEKIL